MHRRQLLGAATLPFLPGIARAQAEWPSQPVRMVIPFAAGGATDLGARLLSDELSKILPQPVVPENRTGAAALVGAQVVAQAPKDGHSLLYAAHAHILLRALYPRSGVDPITSFAPISVVAVVPLVVLVNKDLPVRNLREFLDLLRANPGKYDYGSSGIGGTIQLASELMLKRAGGLRMNHIPYRGSGQGMPDLLAGRITMFLEPSATALPLIQRGDVRGLAITSTRRSPLAPEIPTLAEQGVQEAESTTWHVVLTTAGTPMPTQRSIAAAINRVVTQPQYRRKLIEWGAEPQGETTPETALAFLNAEMAKWEPVIREAGIQPAG